MSAMYYLSRGPTPEGPFEEARLLQMIQSGELTQGGVCPVGQNQWASIDSIPVFAQALATLRAGAAPQPVAPTIPETYPAAPPQGAPNYGAPAQPNYGAQPYGAQPAPGVGPTVPDYGPSPGYAQPAAPAQPNPNAPAPAQPAAKKGNLGLILGLVAGGSALLIGGIALAVYFVFFSSGGARKISQAVPRDCELLIDVPSVRKSVLDLHDVQFLDTSLRDDKQVFDQAADSLVKAFDLSQSDAIALLTATESAEISARKLESKPEVVIALGLRSAGPAEALLKSPRFASAGAVGQSGRRYTLARKQLAAGAGQDVVEKSLSEAEISATDHEQLVWFPSQKVLALGDAALVNDVAQVLESGAASIEQNPAYQAAQKDFDKGARLTAFVDPGALSNVTDPKVKQLVDGYFTPSGPLTSSFRIGSAGFMGSITGHITGSKLPHDDAYEPPQALNLSDKLAAETFAYMAFSTRSKLSGADMEKMLLDQLSTVDARTHNQAEQGIHEFEQLLGVSTAKLLDGIGGQAVLGLAATPGTTLDQLNNEQAATARVNVTYVQELKDQSEFQKLAASLKARILPSAREVLLTPDGAGFTLTPRGTPLPVSLRVKFIDKYLFITAGANTLCDRAEAAFTKGTSTLKDDAAHKTALAALPDTSHFRLWIDTGRLLDALSKNPLVKARMAESGMALDKLTLSGPNRVVTAFALKSEVKLDVWTFRVDALNLQAFAPIGAGGAALAGGLPMLRAL